MASTQVENTIVTLKEYTNVLKYWKFSERALNIEKSVKSHLAGFLLRTPIDITIKAKDRLLVILDLGICLPQCCYGRISSIETNSKKFGIEISSGVIDEDYRGNLGILLYNHSDVECRFKHGDNIAQLICHPICYPSLKFTDPEYMENITDSKSNDIGSS